MPNSWPVFQLLPSVLVKTQFAIAIDPKRALQSPSMSSLNPIATGTKSHLTDWLVERLNFSLFGFVLRWEVFVISLQLIDMLSSFPQRVLTQRLIPQQLLRTISFGGSWSHNSRNKKSSANDRRAFCVSNGCVFDLVFVAKVKIGFADVGSIHSQFCFEFIESAYVAITS